MSKPNRKRLKLETVRAQRMEAHGDKYVEVEFEDAEGEEQVVRFLRQSWWPLPLMKQLSGLESLANADHDLEDAEVSSFLDRALSVLRVVSHDKGLFDQLHGQLTVADFNDIMELVTGDDENGVDAGKSPSSSE
nr:hypothetical protein OG781_18280 [Streptomyces sp. NBC_00830]